MNFGLVNIFLVTIKCHNSEWFVSRYETMHSFPRACIPGEWQLMPRYAQGVSTL